MATRKRRPGRPTLYTEETRKKVYDAIKLGCNRTLAAGYAGIKESTLYEWQAKYPEFAEGIKLAEGQGAAAMLSIIAQAASTGTWQAAAWYLERKYPAVYGKKILEQHHTINVQKVAEDVAQELGLDLDEVIREAEAIMAEVKA